MLSQWEHLYNKNDPRTSEWFLMSRPGTLFSIVAFYIFFCVSAGPRYMRNREPYSLRTTLIVYNIIQVLLSTYMVYEGFMAGWLYEYSLACQPVDYSDNPSALRMAAVTHFYFVCKIIELLDTVFFVLRKKENQITFLHLYHHASMPVGVWFGVRYVAGGHPTLFGLINSFVHIIMYSYYLLAAMGPEIQKYLWWKKYLTLLQMVQFLIVGVHSAHTLLIDCDFPKFWSFIILIDSMVFAYMFGSFYINQNIRNNVSSKKTDAGLTKSRTSVKHD